tara:strand:- start:6517 stop:6900 length:384 start_codon:yes stop_codon:yes gene_type:complete
MKPDTFIDLGKKMDMDMGMDYKEESMETETETETPAADMVHYPSLCIYDMPEVDSLPEEGEAIIKFKRSSVTKSERDGKKSSSLVIDVHAIKLLGKSSPSVSQKEKDAETEDEVDRGLTAAEENDSE